MNGDLLFKVLSSLLVFGDGLLGGYLPIWLRHTLDEKRMKQVVSYGNSFSGGVFLAAGLIHLLGDAEAQFDDVWDTKFPMAETLCGVGLMTVLMLEKVWFAHDEVISPAKVELESYVPPNALLAAHVQSQEARVSDLLKECQHASHGYQHDAEETESQSESHRAHGESMSCEIRVDASGKIHHHHHHEREHGVVVSVSLVLVLSVHSFIAGLAFGVERGDSRIALLIAILAHKWVAGFALVTTMMTNGISDKKRILRFLLLFCVMTPLGILIGTAVSAAAKGFAAKVVTAVFSSLASGTFLYVAIADVIADEFSAASGQWGKGAVLAFGYATMAVLAIWV